mmetsp:Transcript_34609/g.89746  ORF Transcript_34609/g.89746 Transcript_34609/m.89746 type:complete len:123 (-) Transcript_34609:304-672(-)|eukprot:CAMPEP_0113883638 /NCGR_PEP_ID=MMETSP0780_2-20120614/9732_1 /TAXON_ID=652834 /ORGANISM="Palpitomonas bilix" /LENGTH=122 /DNA_ID=CAMNT_0000871007 /DNA_START=78 /DNA_END=446 /DNA_ORIENTATION=- /assembly_acc=CAM_ASM_000599
MSKAKAVKSEAPSLFAKAFQREAEWDKDDFLTVMFWVKLAVVFVASVVVGSLGITGPLGFGCFAVAYALAPIVYNSAVLGVDEEDFGGRWAVVQDSFMPAFGTFLLGWVTTFTFIGGGEQAM